MVSSRGQDSASLTGARDTGSAVLWTTLWVVRPERRMIHQLAVKPDKSFKISLLLSACRYTSHATPWCLQGPCAGSRQGTMEAETHMPFLRSQPLCLFIGLPSLGNKIPRDFIRFLKYSKENFLCGSWIFIFGEGRNKDGWTNRQSKYQCHFMTFTNTWEAIHGPYLASNLPLLTNMLSFNLHHSPWDTCCWDYLLYHGRNWFKTIM